MGWRWRCLRHHSITILVARFLVTTGLHWSPFGLLIAGLGVIITHPWCFDWALYPSMPLKCNQEGHRRVECPVKAPGVSDNNTQSRNQKPKGRPVKSRGDKKTGNPNGNRVVAQAAPTPTQQPTAGGTPTAKTAEHQPQSWRGADHTGMHHLHSTHGQYNSNPFKVYSVNVSKMSSPNKSKFSSSTVENSNGKSPCPTKSIVSRSKFENVSKFSRSSPDRVANVSCLTNDELRNEKMLCPIVEKVLSTQSSPQLLCKDSDFCRNGFGKSMSSSTLPFSPICVRSERNVVGSKSGNGIVNSMSSSMF